MGNNKSCRWKSNCGDTLSEEAGVAFKTVGCFQRRLKRASAVNGTGGVDLFHFSCGIAIKRFRKHNFYQMGKLMITRLGAPRNHVQNKS